MTRASEFCYIAESKDGTFLMAMQPLAPNLPCMWTADPEQAIRFTFKGFHALRKVMNGLAGARKVLT